MEAALSTRFIILFEACQKEGSIRADLDEYDFYDLMLQSSRGMLLDWLLRRRQFDIDTQALKWWEIIFSYIRKPI